MIEAVTALVAFVATGGSWWAAVAAAGAAYVATCWWWPFGFCWCCHGRGKHFRRGGRAFRDCGWCSGRGRRFRVGSVVLARLRDRHGD
ncbi:hypothetical protein [Pseudonocardia sp. NPDC049635]|uniref:hypothetical protein n=1 Tax=Pseudonocardia sp. NPDC049635 TaxID=3155506 RepID=UPI0033D8F601